MVFARLCPGVRALGAKGLGECEMTSGFILSDCKSSGVYAFFGFGSS